MLLPLENIPDKEEEMLLLFFYLRLVHQKKRKNLLWSVNCTLMVWCVWSMLLSCSHANDTIENAAREESPADNQMSSLRLILIDKNILQNAIVCWEHFSVWWSAINARIIYSNMSGLSFSSSSSPLALIDLRRKKSLWLEARLFAKTFLFFLL